MRVYRHAYAVTLLVRTLHTYMLVNVLNMTYTNYYDLVHIMLAEDNMKFTFTLN